MQASNQEVVRRAPEPGSDAAGAAVHLNLPDPATATDTDTDGAAASTTNDHHPDGDAALNTHDKHDADANHEDLQLDASTAPPLELEVRVVASGQHPDLFARLLRSLKRAHAQATAAAPDSPARIGMDLVAVLPAGSSTPAASAKYASLLADLTWTLGRKRLVSNL